MTFSHYRDRQERSRDLFEGDDTGDACQSFICSACDLKRVGPSSTMMGSRLAIVKTQLSRQDSASHALQALDTRLPNTEKLHSRPRAHTAARFVGQPDSKVYQVHGTLFCSRSDPSRVIAGRLNRRDGSSQMEKESSNGHATDFCCLMFRLSND